MRALRGLLAFTVTLAALASLTACKRDRDAAAERAPATGAGAAASADLPDHDLAVAKRLIADEGAVLIDVRTPAEYRTRHIDGAVNISLQDIQRGVEAVDRAVGGARDRALVLYCRSGRRSSIAKRILGQAGFTRISDFGAINDWE